ncbi:recombinase family protein [Peribacillus sp. NPDC097198]|uniref:recombinase family protein n=1 Tax=Peribacillus sp. NPDC097198 TaxID=3364397 RepID=UPI003821FC3F
MGETEEKIEEILFYSIDPFGRDTLININLLKNVIENVGKATFIREILSTGVEHFNMLFLLYSGVAQSDHENLLKNLKDSRKAKILSYGNFDGNYTPLGYRVDRPSKRLVAKANEYSTDELAKQELTILETIYRSYLFGKSLRQIAKDLNNRFGYTRRGANWHYKSVRYILENSAYIGVLSGTLEGTEHYYREDSNIEAQINPIIFALVKKKLEHEKSGRKRKDTKYFPVLMLCRYCGHSLDFKQEKIVCEQCQTEEDANIVMLCTKAKLEDYANDKLCHGVLQGIREKLILYYKIKSWEMESILSSLFLASLSIVNF